MKKYQYIIALSCVLVGAVGFSSIYVTNQAKEREAELARQQQVQESQQLEIASKDNEIAENEERLDMFTDRADNYLIELSAHIENESDNRQRSVLMQCIRDVERIGDYATNFDEMAKKQSADCFFDQRLAVANYRLSNFIRKEKYKVKN